jgi:hypothetical protein
VQGGATAYVNAWDVSANGEYNFEMTLNGSEVITSSSLDASSASPAQCRAGGTVATQIIFGSRAQNDFFQAFDLIEFAVDTTVYNYANSWGGMTINGAILIVSTDGGATWNPA